jgi:ketosteroid isomerase-like protein
MEPSTAQHNKQIVGAIFAALAAGDRRPFADAMSDDFSWTITGHGPWARTWRGKTAVRRDLMAPLFAQFATPYSNRALRLVAEGDTVVVECRGAVTTQAGERYDNHYCYLIEMRDGRMHALTEYMDTALAERVLVAPAS